MTDTARLLGFAFANADFLFEIDGQGKIIFAAGAGNELIRQKAEDLKGKPATGLFAAADSEKFTALVRSLARGDRAGPFTMHLATGSEAKLSLFCLPQDSRHVCCTLTRTGAALRNRRSTDGPTGLLSRDTFLAATAEATQDDTLALVNVPGLPEICDRLGEAEADKLLRHIGVSIMEYGSKAAGRISEDSFGILATTLRGKSELAARVRKALAEGGINDVLVGETLVSLKGRDLTPDQRMLAIRYVVERFANGEQPRNSPGEIALVFHAMMDETQARVRALTEKVADGDFALEYQPIKHLKTGAISHFEALARFPSDENTGETIRFIEALGIADALDLSVALKTLALIESDLGSNAHIAFNISGHTISSPASFAMLAGFLGRNRAHAPRILVEITESAGISDYAPAAANVAKLREMGFRVGIGDFTAGPVSLRYLHALPVDFVKFASALMRQKASSERDDKLIAGQLKLCRELGVHTIAAGLESEDGLKHARALGFDLGQGHALGKPAEMIAFSRGGPRNDNSIRPVARKDVQLAATG